MTDLPPTRPSDSTLSRLTAGATPASIPILDDLVQTLGARFHGLQRLGRGGMGEVFIGRDPALKRNVAIKVLAGEYAADTEARTRFVREAQAAAAVAHPNVVSIYHVGELQATGTPYFAMQYIEGNTLDREYTEGAPAPEGKVRRIVADIAAALDAAHSRGLVHRDIKPSNVMLDPQTARAIVLDFGISASVHDLAAEQRLTAAGAYVGTPRYMSPEQAAGEDATAKSDVYSLGCVAFELLTGRPVFAGRTVMETFAAHLRDPAPLVSSLRPGVDRELEGLVARCLEKDPDARPTAAEIVQRLAPEAGVLLEWPPPGLEHMHAAARRCTQTFAIGSFLTLLALIVFFAWGSALPSVFSSVGAIGVAIIAIAGVSFGVLAGVRLFRTARAAADAVRHGYAWLTVLEVMADSDGETGDLVTGSRRFGGLAAPVRARLRQARIRRGVGLFLAAVCAIPVLILVLVGAGMGIVGEMALWAVVLVPLVCFTWSSLLGRAELKLAPPRRAERTAPRVGDSASAATLWYESFERARAGQSLGGGRARSPRTGALVGAVGGLVAITAALLMLPVAGLGSVGGAFWGSTMSSFATTAEKNRIAQLMRPYTTQRDASITPMAAGTAFFSLQQLKDRTGYERSDVPTVVPAWDSMSVNVDSLFPTAKTVSFAGPSHQAIIEASRRGFNREQLAYLERLAHSGAWRQFEMVARAPRADFLGGRFVIPFPPTLSADQLPIPRFASTKAYAYAAASRAAYFLSAGKRDSAERTLRDVVSFGFALVDNGTTLIENLIGVVIVAIGKDELQRYYTVIGDPRGAEIKTQMDSVNAAVAAEDDPEKRSNRDEIALAAADPNRARAFVYATAMNPRSPRGMRTELLRLLALAPCTNAREMFFGPAADVRSAFANARTGLARFPSEHAVLDVIEGASLRGPGYQEPGRVRGALASAVATIGWAFRNPRVGACGRYWANLFPAPAGK